MLIRTARSVEVIFAVFATKRHSGLISIRHETSRCDYKWFQVLERHTREATWDCWDRGEQPGYVRAARLVRCLATIAINDKWPMGDEKRSAIHTVKITKWQLGHSTDWWDLHSKHRQAKGQKYLETAYKPGVSTLVLITNTPKTHTVVQNEPLDTQREKPWKESDRWGKVSK